MWRTRRWVLGQMNRPRNYFRKPREPSEKAKARAMLLKKLQRRGLPRSWSKLILRLNLKPKARDDLLRQLTNLRAEIRAAESTAKLLRKRIKNLLHGDKPDDGNNPSGNSCRPGGGNANSRPVDFLTWDAPPDDFDD